MLPLLFSLISPSWAVPAQLVQQGRLLDSAGAAVTGTHALTFRLYDTEVGGSAVWEDIVVTPFAEGYYSAVIGANGLNPLDDSILELGPLYLEIQIDTEPPLSPRQALRSAPYARIAEKALDVTGDIHVNSVSIGSTLVIDTNGAWVGPTQSVTWSGIQNIPADIADGDNDLLASIQCAAGQILSWNGANWGCADDNGLTEAQVEAYIVNDPLDLAAGSMVGGEYIVTPSTDADSLAQMTCNSGETLKYDAGLATWQCEPDLVLAESDVESYVVNGPIDLDAQTTLGGQTVMTSPNCAHGEVLSYDANQGVWSCNSMSDLLDIDQDGIMQWDDCDDNDATVLGQNLDNDCDGTYTVADCDDNDPLSTVVANDADCDSALTSVDCNDNDPAYGDQANDMDCDGALTSLDCNDFDSSIGAIANDGDCDGIITVDDCDDADPNSYTTLTDGDCDGLLTADDCDDANPNFTAVVNDADCDGTVTANDCDDTNPNSTILANDGDCDGSPWNLDCDDADPNEAPGLTEICGDGLDNDCSGGDAACFSAVTFSTCGESGRYGPSQSLCDSTYMGTDLAGSVTLASGYQQWVVPHTGDYVIEAYGASTPEQTYSGTGYGHGLGAYMRGEFTLTQGDVLWVLVGQQPTQSQFNGGAGGTFVAVGNSYALATPLIVAGGGGSIRSGYDPQGYEALAHGTTAEQGVTTQYNGGSNGYAGDHGSSDQGSGGSGFYGNSSKTSYCDPPLSFTNGGVGGVYASSYGDQAGGFGGGGCGGWGGSGGGGGYSGGGGGDNSNGIRAVGGGGGSYNGGANGSGTSGAHEGNGMVVISPN